MAKKITETPLYIVEYEQLEKLRRIEKKLYGDGTHLTPDKRRDLANSLNAILDEITSLQLHIGKPKDGETND